MIDLIPPLIVIPSFEPGQPGENGIIVKVLISSLLRSLFSGRITVLQNRHAPMFKIERRALDEVFVLPSRRESSNRAHLDLKIEFLFELCSYVRPEPRQWVIVADAGSVALRNPDHLIPPDLAGAYPPAKIEFYWSRAGVDDISNQSATPGFWAVRGEYLPLVLERLKQEWSKESGAERLDGEAIWTRVVQQLPLRKRAFEKGEVVAPRIGAVDWEAVSNAAFVTVPDWPEKEAWKFLQALYFGTYLGDETGMMLNILEA